ncbi:MAG: hypothetical protein H2042_08315 [Rhizobiales bacterium]|nr:hypothetical protein [Hyphomicrobiales bacterium]
MVRAAAVLLAAAAALLPPGAAAAGCLDGRWPLERESAALAAPPDGGMLEAGARVQAEPFQMLTLALAPPAEPPAQPPAKGGPNSGYILLKVEVPGLYQVTLPQAAWIDVVQQGQMLPAAAFTPAKDCPGVRKSVRFALKGGAALLRISRAEGTRISFVLSRVDAAGE